MAEVWLARQEGPAGFAKELVVKKTLPHLAEDPEFVQMFLDEARLAAHLNHPNVVQIFELGEEAGSYYLVMEYIPGRSLRAIHRRLCQRGERMPFGVLASVLVGACEGVHYAHDLRDGDGRPLHLVHRDVSPDNILVSFEGQTKVVDFGIAKAALSAGTTRTGMLKGKYQYMSPEQVLGQPLDRRSDVYALGVCMYELLVGAPPFRCTSELGTLRAIVEQAPPPMIDTRPDLPQGLVAVVAQALAKSVEDRFPDARAMGRAIEGWRQANSATTMVETAGFLQELFSPEERLLRTPSSVVSIPALSTVEEPPQKPTEIQVLPTVPGGRPVPRVGKARLRARSIGLGVGAVFVSVAVPVWWRLSVSPAVEVGLEAVAESASDGGASDASLEPDCGMERFARDASAPTGGAGEDDDAGLGLAPLSGDVGPSDEPDAGIETTPAPKRGHPLRAPGSLVVRAHPWAQVSVDGRKVGVTPLEQLQLPPGWHLVTLENQELGVRKVMRTLIRPGRKSVVRVDLVE